MRAIALLLICAPVQASYLFNASGEYIYSQADMAGLSYPVTLSCWVKIADWDTVTAGIMGIGVAGGSLFNTHAITKGTPNDSAYVISTDGAANSVANVAASANQYDSVWVNVVGTFSSASLREVSFGGSALQATNTGTRTVSPAVVVIIGNLMDGGANHAGGLVADCALWDVVLSDVNIDLLDGGLVAGCVDPTNLVGYWSLDASSASHVDESPNGGPTLDVTGATFDADHPSMTGCGGGAGTAVKRRRWQ